MIIVIAYLLGSIPTAYIAGRLVKNKDIRTLGDGNMGSQNAFRQFGPRIGFSVGVLDAANLLLTADFWRGNMKQLKS